LGTLSEWPISSKFFIETPFPWFLFPNGGAEGKVFELTLDPLELARKFAELKFSLDCVKMILNSQSEKKDGLVL